MQQLSPAVEWLPPDQPRSILNWTWKDQVFGLHRGSMRPKNVKGKHRLVLICSKP